MRIIIYPINFKRMKKTLLFCAVFCLGFRLAFGADAEATFQQKLYSGFMDYYKRGVPEKLYIQTDKPFYGAGEDIWFKGFLVNGVTGELSDQSKFIYVELITRNNSVLQRQKIKLDEKGFNGRFRLSPQISYGEYVIRAYTTWMNNEDPAYFFTKKLLIGNVIDDRMNVSVTYNVGTDSMVTANIKLMTSSLAPVPNKDFYYTLKVLDKDTPRSLRSRTNANGEAAVRFSPKGSTDDSFIEIRENDDSSSDGYKKRFVIPEFSDKFDIQFFPEGGVLLAGDKQKVAFKAIAATGLSIEVSGKVYDSQNQEVAEFESSHRGMGRFDILPEEGKEYYAEVTSKSGAKKRVLLPAVKKSGCVLSVANTSNRIVYSVRYSPDLNPAHMYVAIQSKGRLLKVEQVNPAKPARLLRYSSLPQGLMNISVMDKEGNILSERLVFVKGDSLPSVSMSTDKPDYLQRELVEMEVKLADAYGKAVSGDFGLSVTDSKVVPVDTVSDNIVSYLLLSSDIKGNIESPAYYFSSNSAEVSNNLDILMMTQGWKRYNLTDVVKKNITPYKYVHEESQTISGHVTGFFGGAAKQPTLIVFIPRSRYLNMFVLDGSHKFNIGGMDVPDSTNIILQTVGRGGGKALSLNVDPEVFPVSDVKFPRGYDATPVPPEYLAQAREKYFYEGGEKIYNFDEIVVTAKRIEDVPVMYNAEPSHRISGDKLAMFEHSDIYTLLATFPGVRITAGGESPGERHISIRNSHDDPLLYIDEQQAEITDLSSINMQEVARVDLISGPDAALFGLGASGGVILINLKQGAEHFKVHSPPSFANLRPLGYSRPVEFYSPKYDTPEKKNDKTPDLRTTIHWDPAVKIDSTGVAKVQFYTADKDSFYNVVLEGVAADGTPCHYEGRIGRHKR